MSITLMDNLVEGHPERYTYCDKDGNLRVWRGKEYEIIPLQDSFLILVNARVSYRGDKHKVLRELELDIEELERLKKEVEESC